MNPKIFPTILMILDVAAAIVYASHKQWGQVVYWTAAAVLTFSIAFMMGK